MCQVRMKTHSRNICYVIVGVEEITDINDSVDWS